MFPPTFQFVGLRAARFAATGRAAKFCCTTCPIFYLDGVSRHSHHLVYSPVYRLAGLFKLITAAASWGTVLALIPIVPKALAMRSSQELEREIAEREKVEVESRASQACFRAFMENISLLEFSRVTTESAPFVDVYLNKVTLGVLSDLGINPARRRSRGNRRLADRARRCSSNAATVAKPRQQRDQIPPALYTTG